MASGNDQEGQHDKAGCDGGTLLVIFEHHPTPDAAQRLHRAFDLLLQAAGRSRTGPLQAADVHSGDASHNV